MSKLQDVEENIPPSSGLLNNQELRTVSSSDYDHSLLSLCLSYSISQIEGGDSEQGKIPCLAASKGCFALDLQRLAGLFFGPLCYDPSTPHSDLPPTYLK